MARSEVNHEGDRQFVGPEIERLLNIVSGSGISLVELVGGGRVNDVGETTQWVVDDKDGSVVVLSVFKEALDRASNKRRAIAQGVETSLSEYDHVSISPDQGQVSLRNDVAPAARRLTSFLEEKYESELGSGRATQALVTREQTDADRQVDSIRAQMLAVKLDAQQMQLPIAYMTIIEDAVIRAGLEGQLSIVPAERYRQLAELADIAADLRVRMEAMDTEVDRQKAMQAHFQQLEKELRRGTFSQIFADPKVKQVVQAAIMIASVATTQDLLTNELAGKAALMAQVQQKIIQGQVEVAAAGAKREALAREYQATALADLGRAQGERIGNTVGGILERSLDGIGKGAEAGLPRLGEGIRTFIGKKEGEDYTGLLGIVYAVIDLIAKGVATIIGKPADEFLKIIEKRRGEIAVGTLFTAAGIMGGVALGFEGALLLVPGSIGLAIALLVISAYEKKFGGGNSGGSRPGRSFGGGAPSGFGS